MGEGCCGVQRRGCLNQGNKEHGERFCVLRECVFSFGRSKGVEKVGQGIREEEEERG